MRYGIIIGILFCTATMYAQDNTRISNKKEEIPVGKIMLVPFEPKLYMSEIDKKINEQTTWNFNQIRENFRHQLDTQLKVKLQALGPVISFYTDSIKMWKDLQYIYGSTHLSYDLIDKPNTATANQKTQGIKNGQVAVEMNDDKKFMNLTITNKELLTYLNKKYKADYFVFINELDLKNDINSYVVTTGTYQRQVTVHYTIFDKTGKLITAGPAISSFSSKENNPKKIISQNFSPIATYITTKFSYIISPPTQVKTEK